MTSGATSRSLAGESWLTAGALPRLLGVLDRDGEEARAVGGAVRNALIGLPVEEIDVATTAVPEEVVRRVSAAGFKPVATGIEHGTVTVVIDKYPFEVTSLRQDVETYGRHAKVAFGRDWRTDAERRDFTINALSAARDGTVYDYVGGLDDLSRRRVRFIGNPQKRIEEDYLRILRFFRFHAAYSDGGHPDAREPGCLYRQPRRARPALARARAHGDDEARRRAARGADDDRHGRFRLAAARARRGCLSRLLREYGQGRSGGRLAPNAVRRLGALAVAVAEDAERLWQKLRLANAEHERLASMAENWRDITPAAGEQAARTLLYRLRAQHFTDRVLLAWARSNATAHDQAWRALASLPQRWNAPVFPLKAPDFIARGVQKGPALGLALAAAEEVWIAAGFPEDPEELDAIAVTAAQQT